MSDAEKTPNSTDNDDRLQDDSPSEAISFERVLDVLQKGDISEEHGSIRWSSNYTYLLTVSDSTAEVLAVYKPRKGERPLWDFPDGTLCNRERASFLTSEALGWQIVPPTVLRDGPNGVGSVQFFVHHDPDLNYFSFDESIFPQLTRLSLFDFLVNNADRKGGHCLIDAQGHLWGIDHGLTFNNVHKLRTVVWNFAGQIVPETLLADVEKLCNQLEDAESDYRKAMVKLINDAELRAFQRRIRRILDQKRYPEPGAGPNYPWPPV